MRHAQRTDGNQLAIVTGLRDAGCSVAIIGHPLDLIVGRAGQNYLLEVKDPEGRNRIEPDQQAFLDAWRGQAEVVRSLTEALMVVGLL